MANYKIQRYSEDIRRELTDIFRGLKDPRIDPLLTIIRVELSGDQSFCKIYVSSVKGMDTAKESVKGLESAAGYVRRELARRVDMRRSPELKFYADNSTEHSAEIAQKLNELHKNEVEKD